MDNHWAGGGGGGFIGYGAGGGGGNASGIKIDSDAAFINSLTDEQKKNMEEQREKWAAEAEAKRVYFTWESLVREEMEKTGDNWSNIESVVPSLGVLLASYEKSYWMPDNIAFTIWTKDRVYFPVWLGLYDEGCAAVRSAPRYPNNQATQMISSNEE